MVLEDIITVRVNRSLIWIAKSFVDVGVAKDMSDYIRKAVSEQIGEDLYSYDTGEFTKVLCEELPKYTTKYAEAQAIRKRREDGVPVTALAKEFQTSQSTIYNVVTNRTHVRPTEKMVCGRL